ncbi:hypothetical protein [Promicromonospora sp. NFX87]|uniref:hypothetical protein n=1 Tax=Promicromonospora sp. NFX87 TaxID=3402691 RepID=UPI003AFA223F
METATINLAHFYSPTELESFVNFAGYHHNGWDLAVLHHTVWRGQMVTVRAEFIDCPDIRVPIPALEAARTLIARSLVWSINEVEPNRSTEQGRESFSWYLFPSLIP